MSTNSPNCFLSDSSNPAIVIFTLFLGGITFMSVGILAEYTGRIYKEVRWRRNRSSNTPEDLIADHRSRQAGV